MSFDDLEVFTDHKKRRKDNAWTSNVRMFECSDGDTGRKQLVFYCSEAIQKRFDGKRVEIRIVEEAKRKASRQEAGEPNE